MAITFLTNEDRAELETRIETAKGSISSLSEEIMKKLDADKLTDAVNEALAEAKAGGEFDGADGVSCTHSWSGTVLTVTSASGTSSADLKGDKGADGKTPVKGVDYWTPADRESIVQDVIAALGTPVFGRVDEDNNIILTGELANGTYTFYYEDADGKQTVIGTLGDDTPAEPAYTDQLAIALGSDGNVYGGVGYRDGYRLTTNGTDLTDDNYAGAATGHFVTGYIPYPHAQAAACVPFYVKGVNLDTITNYTRAALFNTFSDTSATFYVKAVTLTVTDTTGFDVEKLGDQYYKLTPRADFYKQTNQPVEKINYIRFSLPGTGAGVIITVNEPVE